MEEARGTILIADDEESIRGILCRRLEAEGYICDTASDGKEALWKAFIKDFDLVIMDIKMPGMSGIEALPQMVNNHPDVAVIMLTAVVDADTAVEAMKLGAYDYVTKPFDLDDLTIRVEKALERRRLILESKEYNLRLEQRVREQAERMQQYYQEAVEALSKEHIVFEEPDTSRQPQDGKPEKAGVKTGGQSTSVREFAKKLTQLFSKGVPELSREAGVTPGAQMAAKIKAPRPASPYREKEKQAVTTGNEIVELEIKSPVSLDQVLQLHQHLKSISQIKDLHVEGSIDKDITISMRLSGSVALDEIVRDFPQIEYVCATEERAKGDYSGEEREGTSVRRIVVRMTRALSAN